MKQILHLNITGVLCAILFGVIFFSFQNEKIYNNTLGLISKNYERTGTWDDWKIQKVKKPYLNATNDNFLQWDASIYSSISKRMYKEEKAHFGKVRAAFFPMFPMIWKITHLSPRMISLFNYLIFILSLSLLVTYLLPRNKYLKFTSYLTLITLPTSVIFMIPYSEGLFLFFMTIASIGILKKKYALYFFGILLMSMVRPATLFVLLAIISTEILLHIGNKKKNSLVKNILVKSLPFLIGYGIVFLIQYLSSGSWTALLDAQEYWSGGIKKISAISDWSVEGFGLNTFSIFFVAIPAIVCVIYLGVKFLFKEQIQLNPSENKNYLLLVSLFYLAGIFLFTIITSGGNIHSFFRFTMCSPCFYIAILIIIASLPNIKPMSSNLIFGFLFILLCVFLATVEYGGNRFEFSYLGILLLTLSFFYLINRRFIPIKYDFPIMSLIIIFNTIWNTYMLNVFFSNGWIFT